MLQQTRVEAVRPYFDAFLQKFPRITDLAAASEMEVLAAWSGLGYYSRARNLQKAARELVSRDRTPTTYDGVLSLPGIGPYTAAAISSIALGLPYAAVDGNVIRVIARLTGDSGDISTSAVLARIRETSQCLLDRGRPGDFNQAVMELGATICLPRNPTCPICPVADLCVANAEGIQDTLPAKKKRAPVREVQWDLLVSIEAESVYLVERDRSRTRMASFWELPDRALFPDTKTRFGAKFRHQIVNDRMEISVWTAEAPIQAGGGRFFNKSELGKLPLTTVSRKALRRVGFLR